MIDGKYLLSFTDLRDVETETIPTGREVGGSQGHGLKEFETEVREIPDENECKLDNLKRHGH